jgi:hypothetical protein
MEHICIVVVVVVVVDDDDDDDDDFIQRQKKLLMTFGTTLVYGYKTRTICSTSLEATYDTINA